MGLFDRIKGFFSNLAKKRDEEEFKKIFGETTVKELQEASKIPEKKQEKFVPLDLPEGELVSFDDEVLDTESPAAIQKFKHNLEVLMNQTKQSGKVNKFMLVREDDFFPNDWEWRVLSKNTNLESESTVLSYELRKAYALEQSGIEPYVDLMGMRVPNSTYEQELEAMSKVDKTLGNVLLPSRFRSTKHFTVNTPLGVTGDYNSVETDRDFIIMDDMNAFLASGYGYSVAYHDAYLDVSHEALPISENALVLIDDKNYDRIMSDEKIAKQLSERRVIRFKGDRDIAIDMVLAENGALPSQIGTRYADYDMEIRDIIDGSIKDLARDNGLFHDKSHAGALKEDGGGHFSNYYDDKNKDYEQEYKGFINFLKSKFPEHEDMFPDGKFSSGMAQDVIDKIGTTDLLDAINEYNNMASEKMAESIEAYKQDRGTITPTIHKIFTTTITLINDFYKEGDYHSSFEERTKTEEAIKNFLQTGTVAEQLDAAKSVYEIMLERNKVKPENTLNNEEVVAKKEEQGEER